MLIPNTEREALSSLMAQTESDLKSAHAEICKLAKLDPATHSWPEWSPQANTLRWISAMREKFGMQPDKECAQPHKVMTPEEYASQPIEGWHSVCRDVDGAGNTGVRYHG